MTRKWNSLGRFFIVVLIALVLQACAPVVPTPSAQPFTPIVVEPAPTSNSFSNRPPACTQIGQRWVSPKDNVMLVCVPAGEFLMGASENDPNASSDEMPQHRVYLDAFWIDQTEVNNADFTKCVTDGICHLRLYTPYGDGITSATHLDYYANPIYGNYPVILYDGDEAQTFCKWAGKRLPSEAEWEKAARGTDGRTFPWGEGIDCEKASYFECEKDTTPVDAHPSGASPYGALNMAGSVWEWVADWYSPTYYATSETRNPHGPATGAGYVVRGGGWRSNTQTLRVTSRMRGTMQHYFDSQIGFRCAMNDQVY